MPSTPEPALSVVVGPGEPAAQRATVRALAGQSARARVEVVVVRRPPPVPAAGADGDRLEPGHTVRVVDDLSAGASAGVNAGIAAARGRLVLLLAAGDVPAHGALLDGHLDVHRSRDAAVAVVGRVRDAGSAHPVLDGWIGLWPVGVPRTACRHLSIPREALGLLDGLDDRLHDLDVAAVDLLARAAGLGMGIAPARLTIVASTGPPALRRCREAGRSAQALDRILVERGAATVTLGPRRARPALRWARPVLAVAGRRGARAARLAARAAFAQGRARPLLPTHALDRVGMASVERGVDRPAVTVVVPFAGDQEEARALLDCLGGLERREHDAVIVVDNGPSPTVAAADGVQVVRADAEPSSYHARNAGAEAAATPWLLFLDADCVPAPWLLDAYFSAPVAERCGAVAGAVLSAPGDARIERFSDATGELSQPRNLGHPHRPFAVTANLLVRRTAFEQVGGFAEGVRSGGDVDFCWRLQAMGWRLDYRPRAAVAHRHRTSLRGLLRQYRRYGGGEGWLRRRHAVPEPSWSGPRLALATGLVADLALARFELASVRALDQLRRTAAGGGRLLGNRPPPWPHAARSGSLADHVLIADEWPPAAGANGSAASVVEAARRPSPLRRPPAGTTVVYREDDSAADRIGAVLWLAATPDGRRLLRRAAASRTDLRSIVEHAPVARRMAPGAVVVPASADAEESLRHVTRLAGVAGKRLSVG